MLTAPLFAFEKHLNLAMQTVVCRRRAMTVIEPRYKAFYADTVHGREPRVARARTLAVCAGLMMCAGAALLIPIGIVTLFRARRLYAACATAISRAILRLYGIRMRVHGAPPWPSVQTVYVSNHTSTLDIFILVALGMPGTRGSSSAAFFAGFFRSASSAR